MSATRYQVSSTFTQLRLTESDGQRIIIMAAAMTTTMMPAMTAMCIGLASMCRKNLNRALSGTRFIPHVGQRPG